MEVGALTQLARTAVTVAWAIRAVAVRPISILVRATHAFTMVCASTGPTILNVTATWVPPEGVVKRTSMIVQAVRVRMVAASTS